LWCNRIESKYAAKPHRKQQGYGDTFFMDDVFIKIDGNIAISGRPGCSHDKWLDAHHVMHWTDGGETSADNPVLLCCGHHVMGC